VSGQAWLCCNTHTHTHTHRHELLTLCLLVRRVFGAGEVCMHIAVVNQDIQLTQLLLKNGAELNEGARADGNFFKPEGKVYYGEYPLSFAISTGQKEMAELLLQAGARVDNQDTYGNTALHMAVIHERADMYDFLLDHGANPMLENEAGDNMFMLATRRGSKRMFNCILVKSKQQLWSYGPVTCSRYPLTSLDIPVKTSQSNLEHSALYLIVRNKNFKLINHPLVIYLLEEKWRRFARTSFLFEISYTLLFAVLFTIALILRPGDDDKVTSINNTTDWIRYALEFAVFLIALFIFYSELQAFRRVGWRTYFDGKIRERRPCVGSDVMSSEIRGSYAI